MHHCVEPARWVEEGMGRFLGHEVTLAFYTVQDPLLGQWAMLPCDSISCPCGLWDGLFPLALCLLYPAQGLLLRYLSAQHHPGQSNGKAIY